MLAENNLTGADFDYLFGYQTDYNYSHYKLEELGIIAYVSLLQNESDFRIA